MTFVQKILFSIFVGSFLAMPMFLFFSEYEQDGSKVLKTMLIISTCIFVLSAIALVLAKV